MPMPEYIHILRKCSRYGVQANQTILQKHPLMSLLS
jgi:hypothetical protein